MRRLTDEQRDKFADRAMWYTIGVATVGVPYLIDSGRSDLAGVVAFAATGVVMFAKASSR